MSPPTITQSTPPSISTNPENYDTLIHNVSLGALVVCPIIMMIPPRKLDFYTVGLLGGIFLGGNQLSREYTGMSILQRFGNRMQKMGGLALPPAALETQQRLRQEKADRIDRIAGRAEALRIGSREEEKSRVMDAVKQFQNEEQTRKQGDVVEGGDGHGKLGKGWIGGEKSDWKKARDQREKQALEEGRGYGGLIADQIWEVWNWGREKNEEVKEKSEEAIAERKAASEAANK